MRTDVTAMKAFYGSQLGEVAARQLARMVAELWPDLSGQTVVGIGYPAPILDRIAATSGAARAVALMPAEQGAWPWPSDRPSRTALMRESQIPLADSAADRILLLHALEDVGPIQPFLREIWRTLSDSGRLLVIAANRRGLWSRTDATPFGHGRPYSIGQLRSTLESAMFAIEQETVALYVPPSRRALTLWSADTVERFGRRHALAFGGVVAIDAAKSLYGAAPTQGRSAVRRQPQAVPAPATDIGKAKAERPPGID